MFLCRAGTVHGDEGLVHEERSRLRPGLLHHSTVNLQRPAGPEGTDPTSKGHRGCECLEPLFNNAHLFDFCFKHCTTSQLAAQLQPPTPFMALIRVAMVTIKH